jgi:hypothetical protein
MTESELMDLILERPGLYIGHESVIKAEAFIRGFAFANPEGNIDPLYSGFTRWLIDRRGLGQYSWSSILTMMGGSEASAFQLAKELWNEYKIIQEKEINS